MKCDEGRPACQKCVRGNRKCVGVGYSTPAPTVAFRPLHPEPVIPTTMEQSLSHYFHTQVIALTMDEFNVELWRYSLPQVTHSMTAVWHASNAMAGISWAQNAKANLAPGVVSNLTKESTRQYSQSIKALMKITESDHLSDENKTTILLTNILYVIYNLYFADGVAALAVHFRSCQLIRSWRFWECVKAPWASELAAQVLYYYVRIDNMLNDIWLRPRNEPHAWHEAFIALQQCKLTPTMGAYLEMEMLWNDARAVFSSLPFQPTMDDIETARSQRLAIQQRYTSWSRQYTELFASMPLLTPMRRAAVEVWRVLLKVLLEVDLDRFENLWDEVGWDQFEDEFEFVVDLVETAIKEEGNSWGYEVQLAPQLWKSLHFVVKTCREPVLRRRAAILLRIMMFLGMDQVPEDPRAPADDKELTPIQRLIGLEEAGWRKGDSGIKGEPVPGCECVRDEFICNLHRVASVSTGLDGEGSLKVTFATVGDLLYNKQCDI